MCKIYETTRYGDTVFVYYGENEDVGKIQADKFDFAVGLGNSDFLAAVVKETSMKHDEYAAVRAMPFNDPRITYSPRDLL